MSAEIRTSPDLVAGTPKPLFEFVSGSRHAVFAVSADGQRFLMDESEQRDAGVQQEIALVLNWAADIK